MSSRNEELGLPFVLYSIGESKRQAPIIREHGFEAHHFIWLKSGSGVFTVCGQRLTLAEGEGIFMRANVPHSYEGDNMWTRWCTFKSHESLLSHTIGDKNYILFKVPEFLEQETAALQDYARGNSSTLALSAAGYSYITELFSYICKDSDGSIVEKVNDYLINNYAEAITLEDICEAVGKDRYSLCHEYKRLTGRTVMDVLLDVRIRKAKRMLRYTTDAVEQVGRNCGFESPSYFCKRFRRRCGITPGEYRIRRYG